MRFRFRDCLEQATNEEERVNPHFLLPYLPYWCAGMYVFIEGWNSLAFSRRLLVDRQAPSLGSFWVDRDDLPRGIIDDPVPLLHSSASAY